MPVDKFAKALDKAAKDIKAWGAGNNILAQWPEDLADLLAEVRTDESTGSHPIADAYPMEREGAWMVTCQGIASVVAHLAVVGESRFLSFQPEVPREATQYTTPAPIKTMPLNSPEDLERIANSISMFGGTDFLEWQGTVILESAKAAHWNGFSAALVEAVSREVWSPNVSMAEDKSVTMKIGRIVAKATADGLSIKFTGKPEAYLSILRGVFRGGDRE